MTDVIDFAQRHETMRREIALRETLARAGDPAPRPFSFCEGCGDEIDDERRQALPSAARCIHCQEAAERRRRIFRE